MSDPVLVVGATGNVGRAVTASLLAAGIPVRAADRDPARVPAVLAGGVQTTPLDLRDPATFAPALAGAAALFLLRPPPRRPRGPHPERAQRRGVPLRGNPVAAAVFADPAGHRSRGYLLTGPEAITFDEVARTLSAVLGRPIRYEPATVPGCLRHLRRRGAPLPRILVQTILHTGLRRGGAEQVDPTVQRLLARPARTLAGYVRDEAPRWARA